MTTTTKIVVQKVAVSFVLASLTGGMTYLAAVLDKIDITAGTPVIIAIAGTVLGAVRTLLQALSGKYAANGIAAAITETPEKK